MATMRDLDEPVVDAGLAVVAAAVTVPLAIVRPDAWPDIGALTPVLAVAASTALVVRRRHPVALALGVGAATALAPVVMVPLFVALYSVGAYASRPAALTVWGAVAVETVVLQVADDGADGLVRGPVIALALGFPVALGMALDARRRLVTELVDRAERAEREQDLLAAAAVAAERARLAREMHDVVAHRVSLMVLHASAIELSDRGAPGGAGRSGGGHSDAAEAALIGTIGRQALDELRQMLDVLRDGAEAAENVPLAPLPGVADVHALAAASRAAGLSVSVEEDGDVAAVPGTVSRTAYRVVQEALTNIHKHAAGAAVDIRLRRCPSGLDVEVVNHQPTPRRRDMPGGGHGLTGLRERVTLLGGQVVAEPTSEGGWAVLASLPVP